MGCSSSKAATCTKPAAPVLLARVINDGKTKAQRKPIQKDSKFQWMDGSGWQNYDSTSDAKLKQAFLVGRSECKFELRNKDGKTDKYSFFFKSGTMSQKNIVTGKVRQLRAPWGMFPPKQAMLPKGDMIVITLTAEQAGKMMIEIQNPRRKDQSITVSIPAKARKGQKIAIPIPGEHEVVEDVAKKQAELNKGMSTGAKVAVGAGVTAAAGACVVGGVILGDHLAGGTLAEDVTDIAADVGEDIAEFAVDAGDAIGDFAEDVGDWLGDTGEDVGDWICSLVD